MSRPSYQRYLVLWIGVASGWSWGLPLHSRAEPADPGQAVYAKICASCHGPDGQGVAGTHEVPLAGLRSVEELARLIERTMPEGEPESCVGDDARRVADYIYREFYSPAARQRKGLDPELQVELMRWTVPQYRNAVADVIGYFTPSPQEVRRLLTEREPPRRRRNDEPPRPESENAAEQLAETQPGLRGSYYRSKGMSKADELAFERVDTRMEFDFAEAAPAEGMPVEQFAIVWDGALTARETGEYQFRITTPNGARLYLNLDPARGLRKLRDDSAAAGQSALIDAWVSSKKLREASARVELLGGRVYPLRLEFFKYMEPTASIKFEWKPPRGTWSVIDQHALTTASASRTFVVTTPFPADDRSLGYERGSSMSHEWQVAAADAAVLAADEVVSRLPLLSGDPGETRAEDEAQAAEEAAAEEAAAAAAARRQQLQDFVVRFAEVAFRHPLPPDQAARLRDVPFAGETLPEAAVRRAIVWILCSPDFIYADLTPPGQPPDAHAIAARLALVLWDSVPDKELVAAADAGQLQSRQQVEQQARRMLQDSRARHKLRCFLQHWLEIEDRDLSKDEHLFPEFDERVIADLRQSLELFLERVVWSESSDYRQLLSADYLLLNQRLLDLYASLDPELSVEGAVAAPPSADAAAAPADAAAASADEYRRTVVPTQERAGVLTHPYLLSAFAYHDNTSPIHRGVFLTRNIVGRALKPPPVAVAFKNEEFAKDLTMREKVTQLTRDSNCMACHSLINPLGFALERYDAVGRWRTTEDEKPLDTTSAYTTESGETIEVDSARDIAALALSSESAHRAFLIQLFQHMTKQVPGAYGPTVIEQMRAEFAADDFHIQNVMVRIAILTAMHGQHPPAEPAAGGVNPHESKEAES
jgi:hypothetical protein